MPVPAGLKSTVTAAIQEASTSAIGPAACGFRLENFTIQDSSKTLKGQQNSIRIIPVTL